MLYFDNPKKKKTLASWEWSFLRSDALAMVTGQATRSVVAERLMKLGALSRKQWESTLKWAQYERDRKKSSGRFAPNPHAGIEAVYRAWRSGKSKKVGNVWTNGTAIYSYHTWIAGRAENGMRYLNRTKYSVSTSRQQNALKALLDTEGVGYSEVSGVPRGSTYYKGESFAPNPRRRGAASSTGRSMAKKRYHRNPPFSVGGITSTLKAGVKDGVTILVAQIATKRLSALVSGLNPVKGMVGDAVAKLGTAVVITIAARQIMPNAARLAGAAAFAEAIRGIGSNVPALAPFLSDYTADGSYSAFPADDGYGAWANVLPPGSGAGLNAWAGEEEYVQ